MDGQDTRMDGQDRWMDGTDRILGWLMVAVGLAWAARLNHSNVG